MKKIIVVLFLAFIVVFIYWLSKPDDSTEFVIFAYSKNLGKDAVLRPYLIKRLEQYNISYQIDENGNVLVLKKQLEDATICCS